MEGFSRHVPLLSPTSSFQRLTKYLILSFQENDRKLVEDILVQREQLLKREIGLCESKLAWAEMENEKMEEKLRSQKGLEDEVLKLKEEFYTMEHSLRMELEAARENYEKELKCERDLCERKVSLAELEKEKLEEKLRVEFDESVRVVEKREKDLKDEILKREEVKRERDLFESELFWARKEKWVLVERLREELEGRIEELEGENQDLRNKIELSNETLGKEFAMFEERIAKMKGVFGSGNVETRASGDDNHGLVGSITDSPYKALNLESFLTESRASPVDQSFKTPLVEDRGSKAIAMEFELEVKTEEREIWEHAADMLSALMVDPELCLASVCALYRQTIDARKFGNTGGFSLLDIERGTKIAKYLINNDPANKLSRSLVEVQRDSPSILKDFQMLAIEYSQQLFTIYQKELDPLFCPKS